MGSYPMITLQFNTSILIISGKHLHFLTKINIGFATTLRNRSRKWEQQSHDRVCFKFKF